MADDSFPPPGDDMTAVRAPCEREHEFEEHTVTVFHGETSTQIVTSVVANDDSRFAAGIAILGLRVTYEKQALEGAEVIDGAFGFSAKGYYTVTVEIDWTDDASTNQRAFEEFGGEPMPDSVLLEDRGSCIVDRALHRGALHQRLYVGFDHVCFVIHTAVMNPDDVDHRTFDALSRNVRRFLVKKGGEQVELD